MATIPSLEEIRQFEYLPQEQRLSWWIDHILQDPCFADNFAERFARAFVGTEDGPFICYRRSRAVRQRCLVDFVDQIWSGREPVGLDAIFLARLEAGLAGIRFRLALGEGSGMALASTEASSSSRRSRWFSACRSWMRRSRAW
jgi:hypothetical protein